VRIILSIAAMIVMSACAPYRLPPASPVTPAPLQILQVSKVVVENKMPAQQLNMEYFPDYNYADERLQSTFRQRVADVPKEIFTASGTGPQIHFVFTKSFMGWKTTTEDSLSIIPIVGILPALSAGANDRTLDAHVLLTIEMVNESDQVLKSKDFDFVTHSQGATNDLIVSLGALSDATTLNLRAQLAEAMRRYFSEVSNN